MIIYGMGKHLEELSKHLQEEGIKSSRSKALTGLDILSVAIGASISLIGQAITAYLTRHRGQRKLVVECPDGTELKRIEVETPNEAEIEALLRTAKNVFILDTAIEATKSTHGSNLLGKLSEK